MRTRQGPSCSRFIFPPKDVATLSVSPRYQTNTGSGGTLGCAHLIGLRMRSANGTMLTHALASSRHLEGFIVYCVAAFLVFRAEPETTRSGNLLAHGKRAQIRRVSRLKPHLSKIELTISHRLCELAACCKASAASDGSDVKPWTRRRIVRGKVSRGQSDPKANTNFKSMWAAAFRICQSPIPFRPLYSLN